MRTLVASLRRLFLAGKVDKARLQEMVDKGSITKEEYKQIIA